MAAETIYFILLAIGGYLLGSISSGYLIVRWTRNIDIREHGTGKIGASNVLNLAGKWAAVAVTLFDIGKGALPVWIAQLIGLGAVAQVTVGLLAIIGHNWPVFLGFKGGRGIFTSLGVIVALNPWLGLIALITPYLFAPIRQVAFGVVFICAIIPPMSWFLYEPFGIAIADRLPVTIGLILLFLLILITRLITPRTELSKSVPLGGVLFYRALFDRDIRDRKLWINHAASKNIASKKPAEQR